MKNHFEMVKTELIAKTNVSKKFRKSSGFAA